MTGLVGAPGTPLPVVEVHAHASAHGGSPGAQSTCVACGVTDARPLTCRRCGGVQGMYCLSCWIREERYVCRGCLLDDEVAALTLRLDRHRTLLDAALEALRHGHHEFASRECIRWAEQVQLDARAISRLIAGHEATAGEGA